MINCYSIKEEGAKDEVIKFTSEKVPKVPTLVDSI